MIYTSERADSKLEIPNVSITEYALRHADRLADKPALIDGPSGRTLTFGQLADGIKAVAGGLHARGFRKGDVLAIYCPNMPEYALVFNAVASVGGINTTVNPLYTAAELAKQLNDANARILVTVPPFLDKALEAAGNSSVEEVYVFGEGEGARSFSELTSSGASAPAVEIDPKNDLVVLPYSSGTTGLPKGVMLTHHNLVANLCQVDGFEEQKRMGEDEIILAMLPFFHIYGMVVVMKLALAGGATVVSMPRFDMEDFLGLIQQYKVTTLPLVPPVVLGLAKSPLVDQFDLSSVRTIFCGAAPLGKELSIEACDRIGCPVVQGYGMTEASPVTHLSSLVLENSREGSIGKVIPETEVRVVDVESGRDCTQGEDGELWIRGPQIMKGYLNQPEETAECIDSDSWYHTGDVGYVDEDGYFFIVDRVKELIKYKAMQVSPAELEDLLVTHPAILDTAVIPSPDEEAGEIPKAIVVLKDADLASDEMAEEIMSFVAGNVAPHKRIRILDFADQIPKSASGKILRRVLVDAERKKKTDG